MSDPTTEATCENCGQPAEYDSDLILCDKCKEMDDFNQEVFGYTFPHAYINVLEQQLLWCREAIERLEL